MQKYIKELVDTINQQTGIEYHGGGNEKAAHFIFDENDNTLLRVQCFGVSFPDKNYEVKRDNKQNIYVIEYVLDGKGYLEIEDKKFNVKAGDAYLIEANTNHHYYSDKANPFKKYWINFTSSSFSLLLEALQIKGIYHFPNTDIIEEFNALFSLEQKSILASSIAEEALKIITSILFKMRESIHEQKNNIPEEMVKAKSLIDENIKEDISLEDICEQLFISQTTLINSFTKYYGVTPKQYRIKQRVNLACIYLRETKMSLKEIASELSFSDAYSFSHFFIKNMGISPKEYRLKNIKG